MIPKKIPRHLKTPSLFDHGAIYRLALTREWIIDWDSLEIEGPHTPKQTILYAMRKVSAKDLAQYIGLAKKFIVFFPLRWL